MSNSHEMYGSFHFWDVDSVSHCPMSKQKAHAGSAGVLSEALLRPGSSCPTSHPADPWAHRGGEAAPRVEEEVKATSPRGHGQGGAGHTRVAAPLAGCHILPRH